MHQKIYVALTQAAAEAILEHPQMLGSRIELSHAQTGEIVAIVYPHHAHLRFTLPSIDGVTVLPGAHDPGNIGDAHKHLAHAKVKPEHTMRQAALLLYAKHGPAFHPDV